MVDDDGDDRRSKLYADWRPMRYNRSIDGNERSSAIGDDQAYKLIGDRRPIIDDR